MDYLMRDEAILNPEQWTELDAVVVKTAKTVLTGRKFLDIYGPLGAGTEAIATDALPTPTVSEDFYGEGENAAGLGTRKVQQIPLLYSDFTLSWRELESAAQAGRPISFSRAAASAALTATAEDKLIYLGNPKAGYDGLTTAKGVEHVKISDWTKGDTAFTDVANGLAKLIANHAYGTYTLVVSPDLFAAMQKLEPGTGVLVAERVKNLLDGGQVIVTPVLPQKTAILLAAATQNMDLVIGQDMITGYLESSKLNHDFRVFETVMPRIKYPKSIIVFEP